MKTTQLIRLLCLVFCCSLGKVYAQDVFLWTNQGGAGDNKWENADNWLPLFGAPAIYPGQSPGNPSADDVAIFIAAYPDDCKMENTHYATTQGFRIGGLIAKGYPGTITEADGHRFLITESIGASGVGAWDGTTTIPTGNAALDAAGVGGMQAYQAYFDFGSGGSFVSGGDIVGGLYYSLLISVPFTLDAGTFVAPKDQWLARNHMTVNSGASLNTSIHQGTVILSNRTSGAAAATRNYVLPNVSFWDLKTSIDGNGPRVKNISGGAITVNNNFITGGLHGFPGGGSYVILNGVSGSTLNIKGDIVVGNTFTGPTYMNALAFGDIVLVMDGNTNQSILHDENDIAYNGNLPALKIDKPSGDVYLSRAYNHQ